MSINRLQMILTTLTWLEINGLGCALLYSQTSVAVMGRFQ